MRHFTRAAAAAVVAGALLVPASAGAQLRNVSASDAVIQPDGRTVTVTLSVTCDPGNTIFGSIATLLGRHGNTLYEVSLSGFPFPEPACTGSPQPFTLDGFAFDGPIPVKNGKGTITSGLIGIGNTVESFGPLDVKIRKK
jgi:hypothetical protein